MGNYEILDHPADLKIRAFGRNLSEAFINIAKAVAEQQLKLEVNKLRNWEIEEIEVESPDLESLLVYWLSEILYRSEANKKVYADFEMIEFSEKPYKIKAKIKGVPVARKAVDIKAVTYHDLEVKKVNDLWETTVLFDI